MQPPPRSPEKSLPPGTLQVASISIARGRASIFHSARHGACNAFAVSRLICVHAWKNSLWHTYIKDYSHNTDPVVALHCKIERLLRIDSRLFVDANHQIEQRWNGNLRPSRRWQRSFSSLRSGSHAAAARAPSHIGQANTSPLPRAASIKKPDVAATSGFHRLTSGLDQASGRMYGNSSTSRIELRPVSSITRRSMPMPRPPVGAMPYSRARM